MPGSQTAVEQDFPHKSQVSKHVILRAVTEGRLTSNHLFVWSYLIFKTPCHIRRSLDYVNLNRYLEKMLAEAVQCTHRCHKGPGAFLTLHFNEAVPHLMAYSYTV